MAAPAFGSAGTFKTQANATACNLSVPSGVAADNIILAFIHVDSSPGTITISAPSGFTQCADTPAVYTAKSQHFVFWKRQTSATGSGETTGTLNFTLSAARWNQGYALRYTGCITSGTPYDADDGAANASESTTTPAVSVTTLGADRLLVWSTTNWAPGTSLTPPTGFTTRASSFTDAGQGIADKTQASAGSTGSLTGTFGVLGPLTAHLLALKPPDSAAANTGAFFGLF